MEATNVLEPVNPACTNCGLNIDEFVEEQNIAEENESEVPEYCCETSEEVVFNCEEGAEVIFEFPVQPEEIKEETEVKETEVEEIKTNQQLVDAIKALSAELAELKKGEVKVTNTSTKKNQKPGRPAEGRKYVLLNKDLSKWGKVPQQQADVAHLLGRNLAVGEEYTEAEVFDVLIDKCGEYPSLCNSKQDPTYLFRYYRGLKNDGKHAGLIARNFIRVIG